MRESSSPGYRLCNSGMSFCKKVYLVTSVCVEESWLTTVEGDNINPRAPESFNV